jgi:hypothetical protein
VRRMVAGPRTGSMRTARPLLPPSRDATGRTGWHPAVQPAPRPGSGRCSSRRRSPGTRTMRLSISMPSRSSRESRRRTSSAISWSVCCGGTGTQQSGQQRSDGRVGRGVPDLVELGADDLESLVRPSGPCAAPVGWRLRSSPLALPAASSTLRSGRRRLRSPTGRAWRMARVNRRGSALTRRRSSSRNPAPPGVTSVSQSWPYSSRSRMMASASWSAQTICAPRSAARPRVCMQPLHVARLPRRRRAAAAAVGASARIWLTTSSEPAA